MPLFWLNIWMLSYMFWELSWVSFFLIIIFIVYFMDNELSSLFCGPCFLPYRILQLFKQLLHSLLFWFLDQYIFIVVPCEIQLVIFHSPARHISSTPFWRLEQWVLAVSLPRQHLQVIQPLPLCVILLFPWVSFIFSCLVSWSICEVFSLFASFLKNQTT